MKKLVNYANLMLVYVLVLALSLPVFGCGTFNRSLGVLGLSTKNAVINAAKPIVCDALSLAQANQAIADSPLCRKGAASLQCLAKQFAVNAVFTRYCGDGSPAARESGAAMVDPNAELAAILSSVGYTDEQAAMKVARLPR